MADPISLLIAAGVAKGFHKLVARGRKRRREEFKEAAGYNPENTHGRQAWAPDAMLEAAGKFKPIGIPVGFSLESNRQIYTGIKSPHVLTLGGTGSGKTTQQLIPTLLSDSIRKTSVIVPDIAAELSCVCAGFRSKVSHTILLDTLHMFPSRLGHLERGFYNPMRSWLNPAHPYFGARAAKLASLLVSKVDGRDQYFYLGARQLVQAVIMAECKYGKNPNLPNVARIINGDPCRYAQFMMRRISDPAIRGLLRRWADPRAASGEIRSLNEVIETARTETAFLMDGPIAEVLSRPPTFTFSDCKRKVTSVFIPLAHEVLDGPQSKFFKLITGCGLAELMRQDGEGELRTLVVADELYQLDLEDLPLLFSGARKFQISVLGCLQDLGQLKQMYPKLFETVLNNTGCLQIMAAADLEGSEHFSKLLGDFESYAYSKSLNFDPTEFEIVPFAANRPDAKISTPSRARLRRLHVTHNYSAQQRRLLLGQEIRALDPALQILIMNSVSLPVLCKRVPYFQTKAKSRADSNPYYRPEKSSFWKKFI